MTQADRSADGHRADHERNADHAVTELHSLHYRTLVRLAALLVQDTPTAEEIVQDSFAAMHGSWQRLRDDGKALTYLRRTVVNRSRSVLRHRAAADQDVRKAPPNAPSAQHGALIQLERPAVIAALCGLPAPQREAIVLRYYGNLSEADIATAMQISRSAVKSHTARGMTVLRAALGSSGSGDGQELPDPHIPDKGSRRPLEAPMLRRPLSSSR